MDRSRNRPSTAFEGRTATSARFRKDISFVSKAQEIHEESFLNPDDEKKEISVQLQLIRKKHDQAREQNLKKRNQLEKLKHDLQQQEYVSGGLSDNQRTTEEKLDHFQNSLGVSRIKFEDEHLNKQIYEHMLIRMKQDQLALEIKKSELVKELEIAKQTLNGETKKSRKVVEQRFQSRNVLSQIKNDISFEKRKKDERILALGKNIRQRQDAANRREERQRRQAEMAEAQTAEDKESQEVQNRESIIMYKFWHKFIKKRLVYEHKRSVHLEQAFQAIKAGTGLSDVDEIVERFLTKEQTYQSLLDDVNRAEKQLEGLKDLHHTTKSQLQELQIMTGGKKREVYIEIEELDAQQRNITKEHAFTKEKLQKSIAIYDQLTDWGKKTAARLASPNENIDLNIPSGPKISLGQHTLEDLFGIIATKIRAKLKIVNAQQEQAQKEITNQQKKNVETVLNEVNNTEFVAKNVRVRPGSAEKEEFEDIDDEDLQAIIESRIELNEEREQAIIRAKSREEQYRRKKRQNRKYY